MFRLALDEGNLPVFVFPQSVAFYLDDHISHKQVLTLYNPYDFPFRFKVLGTSPQKYHVDSPEGSVKSKCCVDIVVKHRQPNRTNEGVKDKFLIRLYQQGHGKKILGKREVTAVLYASRRSAPTSRPEDDFQTLPVGEKADLRQRPVSDDQHTVTKWPSMFLICLGMLCISVLMLPNEGSDIDSVLPSFLNVSVNQKCVAAYILGAITMILVKSYS